MATVRVGSAANDTKLLASYQYDASGNRISETRYVDNNNDGDYVDGGNEGVNISRYRYDYQNRMTVGTTAAGLTTRTSYSFDNTIGNGGGWRKVVRDELNNFTLENQDTLGRVQDRIVGRKAVGSTPAQLLRYHYIYDMAGRLREEVQSNWSRVAKKGQAQRILYNYTAGGQLKSQDDLSWDTNSKSAGQSHTSYIYDAVGNVLRESYTFVDSTGGQGASQDSVMTYDAKNQLTSVRDANYTLDYAYDEIGNRRRAQGVFSRRSNLPAETTDDNWYTYDVMNRLRITKGALVTNAGTTYIDIGNDGTRLSYNGLDARTSALTKRSNEVYSYNGRGQMTGVRSYQDLVSPIVNMDGDFNVTRTYDSQGRLLTAKEQRYTTGAWSTLSDTTTSYNDDGRETTQTSNDGLALVMNSNSYDAVGNLIQSVSSTFTSGMPDSVITTTNAYQYWNAGDYKLVKSTISGAVSYKLDNPWQNGVATTVYDASGHIRFVDDVRASRTINFISNASGQILSRQENVANQAQKTNYYYYVNGIGVGEVGNVGNTNRDYTKDMRQRWADHMQSQFFKAASEEGGLGKSMQAYGHKPSYYADVDANYQAVDAQNNPGQYTVQDSSETLQSIARQTYGDAGLWYLIAEANGMSGAEQLAKGVSLTLPQNVKNLHNTSSTLKPYDPGKAIGDVSPTLPDAPPAKIEGPDSCAGTEAIVTIVAYVLEIVGAILICTGIGAPLGGALMEAGAYMIAAQSVYNAATGRGTWVRAAIACAEAYMLTPTSAAEDAATNAATNGLSEMATNAAGNMAYSAVVEVATQGAEKILGERKSFDWRGVAQAGVSAGLGTVANDIAGSLMPGSTSTNLSARAQQIAPTMAQSLTASVITEGLKKAIYGDDYTFSMLNFTATATASMAGSLKELMVRGPAQKTIVENGKDQKQINNTMASGTAQAQQVESDQKTVDEKTAEGDQAEVAVVNDDQEKAAAKPVSQDGKRAATPKQQVTEDTQVAFRPPTRKEKHSLDDFTPVSETGEAAGTGVAPSDYWNLSGDHSDPMWRDIAADKDLWDNYSSRSLKQLSKDLKIERNPVTELSQNLVRAIDPSNSKAENASLMTLGMLTAVISTPVDIAIDFLNTPSRMLENSDAVGNDLVAIKNADNLRDGFGSGIALTRDTAFLTLDGLSAITGIGGAIESKLGSRVKSEAGDALALENHSALDVTNSVGRSETANALSNLGEAYPINNGNVLKDFAPQPGFSAVYNPESGRFLAYPSGETLMADGAVPTNLVDQFGGHAPVNESFSKLLGVEPTSNFGFSFTVESDGISMGFNSGMVNPRNPLGNGTRAVPVEYQQQIIDAVQNATGITVKRP
ncbi:MAG TPA: hypothetical protein VLB90_08365 [Pseudomonadales bacterium]|nr:hypothetical protein [Pseudomonadales bacterium]